MPSGSTHDALEQARRFHRQRGAGRQARLKQLRRDIFFALLFVGGILTLLFWMIGGFDRNQPQSAIAAGPQYEELPAVSRPDYNAIVADPKQAEDLAADAAAYIGELSTNQAEAQVEGAAAEPAATVRLNTATTQVKLTPTSQLVSVTQLLGRYKIRPDEEQLYFVHTVTKDDQQGVWGVIQTGLIEKFAAGIAVERRDDLATYRVLIPGAADERLPSGFSSFLGKVLHQKTAEAIILRPGLRRPPRPNVPLDAGRDVVVVGFTPAQLIAIYQYFATGGEIDKPNRG